jgi:hypothetical protein
MFNSKFQHLAEIEALRARTPLKAMPRPRATAAASEEQIRAEMERRCLEYLAKRKSGGPRAA